MASEKVRSKWREATKKYNQRQNTNGLCRHCPKPIYRNKRCLEHFEKDKSIQQSKKLRRLETGKCVCCGKPLISEETGKNCVNCSGHYYRMEIHETT